MLLLTRRAGYTNSFGAFIDTSPQIVFPLAYNTRSLIRRLAQDLTHPLITTLQQECSRTTCPEMKAGEWLYLCVAHGTEGAMEVSTLVLSTSPLKTTKILTCGLQQ
jgi:hypothetical protein